MIRGTAEEPLFRVVSVNRTSDCGIALANASSAQLRRYGSDGTLRWSVGTKGGGPGEFMQLQWSGVMPGDSLLAYDASARRYSVFDPAGVFVRTVQPQSTDAQPVGTRPVGVLEDGALLVSTSGLGNTMPPNGAIRDTARLLRMPLDGMLGDTIDRVPARVPGDERVVQISPQSVNIITPPFAGRFVAAPDGRGSVAAEGPTFELTHRDAAGRLQQLVRLAGVERLTTEAMVDAYVESRMSAQMDAALRASTEEGLRSLPRPQLLPPMARVLVDAQRRVWAMDFEATGDTVTTWRVFDADGRYLGAVPIPAALTVREIGDGWLLGVFRDEDDVEDVRVYELLESTSPAR